MQRLVTQYRTKLHFKAAARNLSCVLTLLSQLCPRALPRKRGHLRSAPFFTYRELSSLRSRAASSSEMLESGAEAVMSTEPPFCGTPGGFASSSAVAITGFRGLPRSSLIGEEREMMKNANSHVNCSGR